MDEEYLGNLWMGLRWTAWMPLMAAHPLAQAQLPSEPGFYRIRRADLPTRLEWIGWEPRGIRDIVERLSRQVHMPVEPYNDPNSPARALWRLRQSEGASFDVSGAPCETGETTGRAHEAALREEYRRTCSSSAVKSLGVE